MSSNIGDGSSSANLMWPNTSRLTVPYSSTQQRRKVWSAPRGRSMYELPVPHELITQRRLDLVVGWDREGPPPEQIAEDVQEDLPELITAIGRRVAVHLMEYLKPGYRAAEDHAELGHVRQRPGTELPASGDHLEYHHLGLGEIGS